MYVLIDPAMPGVFVHTILRAFHSHVWRRLPYGLRRSAFFWSTTLLAPHPDAAVDARFPLIVVGALTTASGLGESARLCLDALRAAGLPAYGIDLTSGLMQPKDFMYDFPDGRALIGPGTLIIHANAPLMGLVTLQLGRDILRNKYVVGYWAWELMQVPAEWSGGISFVHRIWVPSRFTAASVAQVVEQGLVEVVPHPLAAPTVSPTPTTRKVPFTFLTLFNMTSSLARKNPFAVISAFQKAFGDDPSVRLIVKCTNASDFPEGANALTSMIDQAPNVLLVNSVLSRQAMEALYAEASVLVSLHRSEGFGLTLAEAMFRGLPVIATNWSGSVDILDDQSGMPIPFTLVPAVDPQGTYHFPRLQWADADITAAAKAMRLLRDDPSLWHQFSAAGEVKVRNLFSSEAYADRVQTLLGLHGDPSNIEQTPKSIV